MSTVHPTPSTHVVVDTQWYCRSVIDADGRLKIRYLVRADDGTEIATDMALERIIAVAMVSLKVATELQSWQRVADAMLAGGADRCWVDGFLGQVTDDLTKLMSAETDPRP